MTAPLPAPRHERLAAQLAELLIRRGDDGEPARVAAVAARLAEHEATVVALTRSEVATELREVVAHNVRRTADLPALDAAARQAIVRRADGIADGSVPLYGVTL